MGGQDQRIHSFSHFAMKTTFEVVIPGQDESYSRQVSQAVFEKIDQIESQFSRFDPCSEIGQINQLKLSQSKRIGFDVYECLETSAKIKLETNGAFDVNVASLIEYKRDASSKKKSLRDELQMPAIELSNLPDGFTVTIISEEGEVFSNGVKLDLGGIGKGYALDKAKEILCDWSIDRALLHGGTSTALACGTPDVDLQGWPLGVGGDWDCSQVPKKLFLKDRALSSSGTEVKGEHIFDPTTGDPAKGHLAAWVSHPTSAVADALSTAFMIMSSKDVESYCNNHPDVWAFVVTDKNTCEVFNPEIILTQK